MATQATAGTGRPTQISPQTPKAPHAEVLPHHLARDGASPYSPARPSLLTLERLRDEYKNALHQLQQHERRYSPINRGCVSLLKVNAASAGLRESYREQDGLRRALIAIGQRFREQAAHLPAAQRERLWHRESNLSGSSSGSDAAPLVDDELAVAQQRPAQRPFFGTYMPDEKNIAHLNQAQQERYLADYLRLPHAAPRTEQAPSTLSLLPAEQAPRFVSPPSAADEQAISPTTVSTLAAAADTFAAPVAAAAPREATANAAQQQLAQSLIAMRDQQALSPRDMRGINLAIAERAARDCATNAVLAARNRLVALDVPQEVAAVFGHDPVDYFDLPVASHAWYDACLDPRKQRLDFADVVREGLRPALVEPPFHVLRWEDPSKQKHVFVRFHDHGTKRQGLLTLQQFVQTAAGPHADSDNSHSAWRVLDPYRFRSTQLRHFPDAINVGASRKLNQLSLKREVRELLVAVGEMVHTGSHQETGGAARLLVLGPPQRPTSQPLSDPACGPSEASSVPPPIAFAAPSADAPAPRNAISAQTLLTLPPLPAGDAAVAGNEPAMRGRAQLRAPGGDGPPRNRVRRPTDSIDSVGSSCSPRRSTDSDLVFSMSPVRESARMPRASTRNAFAVSSDRPPAAALAPPSAARISPPIATARRPQPTPGGRATVAPSAGAGVRKPTGTRLMPLKSAMRPTGPAARVAPRTGASPTVGLGAQPSATPTSKHVRHAERVDICPIETVRNRPSRPVLHRSPTPSGRPVPAASAPRRPSPASGK